MKKALITVAQIGFGYWGPNLLRSLATNPCCRLKWACDLSAERRKFVEQNYPDVGTTAKISDIIKDEEVDAVVIATPAATHFSLGMECLRANKHILVEKPMAISIAEIDALEKIATRKKRVAMAAHTFIYNDAVRYLKKLIDDGELGEIRYIYSQRLNLGRIRSDVDALWNFAPHDVSIIQYLLGDPVPKKVSRQGMDFIQKGVDDVVFLNIKYPKKVMAHIHVSWLDPHKVRQMTVVGSRKMVVYDDVSENKITIYDKGIEPKAVLGERMDYDQPAMLQFVHRSGDIRIPKIDFREPLKVEINHFLDCILNGVPCLTGTKHAREVIRILSSAS